MYFCSGDGELEDIQCCLVVGARKGEEHCVRIAKEELKRFTKVRGSKNLLQGL
jgi:hypothetical protein